MAVRIRLAELDEAVGGPELQVIRGAALRGKHHALAVAIPMANAGTEELLQMLLRLRCELFRAAEQ